MLIQAVHSKVIQGLLRVIALGTLFYGFLFSISLGFFQFNFHSQPQSEQASKAKQSKASKQATHKQARTKDETRGRKEGREAAK